MLAWTLAALVVAVVYVLFIRGWHMSLGATAEEAGMRMPGDELVPAPLLQATHAITIRAKPAEIWPWLVQIGQGRAGFYSYDWLEQLFGCGIYNVYRVVPELQSVRVGDAISLHVDAPPLSVFTAEPDRALVLGGGPALQAGMPRDRSWYRLHTYTGFTWAFLLDPRPDGTTRFFARIRVHWDRDHVGHFFRSRVFLEPVHTIMQRKMNAVLKACAEGRPPA